MRQIKYKIVIILIFELFYLTFAHAIENNRFYIWQRDWQNPKLMDAVKASNCKIFYFLASEFEKDKIYKITPSKAFFQTSGEKIPVFRIHLSFFKKWINKHSKINEIVNAYNKILSNALLNNTKINELQIDLDTPESKLGNFIDFMQELKINLPIDTKLSFTALPCHLNNPQFEKLANTADYYVLQVHGLEYPKNEKDKVFILNPTVAKSAIDKAEQLNKRYILALPTYAYQLNFSKENGDFLFLNAEKIPLPKKNIRVKIIAPKLKDLIKLVKFATTKQKNTENEIKCLGIIWFRLPIKGDRLNFDLKTINSISSGIMPKQKITATWKLQKNGVYHLIVENFGIISQKQLSIHINSDNLKGKFDLLHNYKSNQQINFQKFPKVITGSIPPPGEAFTVAWFRQNNKSKEDFNKTLTISLQDNL
jgi:hypothetical protein